MKNTILIKIIYLLITALSFTPSLCKAGTWTRKADFPGGQRDQAYGFAVGNKAYVGGGYNSGGAWTVVNDLWEFDPALNIWTLKSTPPFNMNIPSQCSFTIGAYGYVFTDSNQLWQYDTLADRWTRMADMPGAYNVRASHLVIGKKVYIGGSIFADSSLHCFDPITNSWTITASAPYRFIDVSCFASNNKGYITCIWTGMVSPQVLEFDPISDSWAKKADFPGPPRTDATAFTINDTGYIGTGDSGSGAIYKDLWQYNAITDSWIQKDTIPCRYAKDEDPSFVINGKGYICFGADINLNAEIWEYNPYDAVTEVREIANQFQTNLYPNPAATSLTITSADNITTLSIINLLGQTLYTHKYNAPQVQVDLTDLLSGIYLVKVNGTEVRKFVKQ